VYACSITYLGFPAPGSTRKTRPRTSIVPGGGYEHR
jgi:hypothetical protein